MKIKAFLAAALMAVVAAGSVQAQGLGDLLKGGGSTIGNIVEGIFTKSDLTLEDIVGEYQATGPAVAFKGDNFLKKAGGIAGAAALETKIAPYYKQYGLTGMKLEVTPESDFTMTVKGVKLMGKVEQGKEKGTFTFNILMANKVKLGRFTAYVEKSGSNINLMFDANKLKELVSTVTRFTGSKMAGAFGAVLDSYDGACIGFKMTQTEESKAKATEGSNVQSGLNSILNRLKSSGKEN